MSELRKFSQFHILKLLFPSICYWYLRYFVSETCISSGFKFNLHTYTINAVSFLLLKVCAINDSILIKHSHWENICVFFMRANSDFFLLAFSHSKIAIFRSIFCWFFRYSVGTNDMLVGLQALHVPTNFQMYRQNAEKSIMGGKHSCYSYTANLFSFFFIKTNYYGADQQY